MALCNTFLPARSRALCMCAGLLLAAACGSALAGPALRIDGAVGRPTSVAPADLAATPAAAQAVRYTSGGATRSFTYTGVPLWSLLEQAGLPSDPAKKFDLLDRYVLATGADGYRVVFALGELNPAFGNSATLVAYGQAPGAAPGPAAAGAGAMGGTLWVTAPDDRQEGRYVSHLDHVTVRTSGSTAAGTGGGPSASFAVSGAVQRPRRFDLAALQALPASTAVVGGKTYTGVSLWTLLDNATGIVPSTQSHYATLPMYAVATGSDGYKALVSLGEIDPANGRRNALVAWQVDGQPLGPTGMARLIVPGDVKQGRSVANLAAIEVFTAPAEPAPR